VTLHPEGASFGDIAEALTPALKDRPLQYRLRYLVDRGRLITQGGGRRWTRYRGPEPQAAATAPAPAKEGEEAVPLSKASIEIRRYLSPSIAARKPVGYHRRFLDSYRPNVTFYLSEAQRAHLAKVGTPNFADQTAGTYAKQILNRRLIDLSWNSRRLGGNTDSLLDTSTRNNNIYAQLKLVYTQLKLPSTGEVAYSAGTPRPCRRRPAAIEFRRDKISCRRSGT